MGVQGDIPGGHFFFLKDSLNLKACALWVDEGAWILKVVDVIYFSREFSILRRMKPIWEEKAGVGTSI